MKKLLVIAAIVYLSAALLSSCATSKKCDCPKVQKIETTPPQRDS
ncbi:MAG: hypothetical protein KatS3mg031_1068 [Chitinophagales bacterium]|nr:MAG: hypothetical protein KatS3mg031_1068 [Chitinophagales bacterium]